MIKTAIISQGNPAPAAEAALLFNEGNRIRVAAIATDTIPEEEVVRRLDAIGCKIIKTESASDVDRQLAAMLSALGVSLVAWRNDKGELPADFTSAFPGSLTEARRDESFQLSIARAMADIAADTHVELSYPEPESIEIDIDTDCGASKKKSANESETPSVDEAWARTLQMDYDEETARLNASRRETGSTPPPPLPGHNPYSAQFSRQDQQPKPPMPETYLIWSVLATLFCCFVPGIIGIILSSQVSSRYLAGDYAGAERASRQAQIWIIVSVVLGLIAAPLYLVML